MRSTHVDMVEYENVRDDLREAFGTKDARSGLEVATSAAAGWTRRAEAGTLNFAHIYAIAKALDCAAKPGALGADSEPETDPAKLRAAIDATLKTEWSNVQETTKELRKNPSVLGLAAAGDERALRAHLEQLKAVDAAPPPAAPVTPAPAAPLGERPSKLGFWKFKRDKSPGSEATDAQTAQSAGQAAGASRAAPSKLREELLELSTMGASPLMLTVDLQHAECVAALLEAAAAAGPDCLRAMLSQQGRRESRGHMPFAMAIIRGLSDIALALARAGADLRAPVTDPIEEYGPKVSPLQMLVKKASEGMEGGVTTLQEVLKLAAKDPDFDVNGPVKRKPPPRRRASEDSVSEEESVEEEEENEEEGEPGADEEGGGGGGRDDDEPAGGDGDNQMRRMYHMMLMERMGLGVEFEEDRVPTMLDVAAACSHGARVDVIKTLLAAGAKPNAKTLIKAVRSVGYGYDWTGKDLMGAQVAAGVAAFTALVDAADDVNAATAGSKNTALHEAARLGVVPVAKLLLARKANTGARDEDGHTPMQVAEENDNRAMVDLLASQHLLRRLLSGGGGSSARRRQAEALPDDLKCVICCSAPKEVITAPCGHKSTCKRCTKVLLTRPTAERNCPVCRERIDSYVLTVYEV